MENFFNIWCFSKEKVKNKYLFKDNIKLKSAVFFLRRKQKIHFKMQREVSNWLKERK